MVRTDPDKSASSTATSAVIGWRLISQAPKPTNAITSAVMSPFVQPPTPYLIDRPNIEAVASISPTVTPKPQVDPCTSCVANAIKLRDDQISHEILSGRVWPFKIPRI